MSLHLIPDDGRPHAPTTECGCGPQLADLRRPDGTARPAFRHREYIDIEVDPPDPDSAVDQTYPRGNIVLRRIGVAVSVGVALVAMLAATAVAVNTYRIGGHTDRQYISTSADVWLVPGPNTWQTVPATTISFTTTARRLITARFSAESQCLGAGWCSIRVVYTRAAGPVTELAPAAGTDYAFDSAGDAHTQHTVERTSALYVPAGAIRVWVQAQRVRASSFRLDERHLNVGTIAP